MKKHLLKVFGKNTLVMIAALLAVILLGSLILSSIQYFTVGQSGNDIFYTKCEYVDVLQYTKSFVPESIQNAVTQQGYTLEIVDEVPGGILGRLFHGVDGSMSGKTDPLTKQITVKAVGENGPIRNNEFAAVFIHEYGHAISYTYGQLSETKEFQEVYNKALEYESPMFSDYSLQSASEYFAESFMAYIVAREKLQVWYPDTAEFFDNFFETANDTPARVGVFTYAARTLHAMSEKFVIAVPLMVFVSVLFGLFMVLKQHKLDKLNLTPPVSTTER